jgi:hypothetical protein
MSHHLSEDQICRAIAGQSTSDERRHVDGCAECRTEIDRFGNTLALFRSAVTGWADREARRSALPIRSRLPGRLKWEWALAAAAFVAAVATPGWPVPGWSRAGSNVSVDDGASDRPAEEASEFFPLMYSNVPVTNGQTVRLELPQSALASFGLEADDASGTVLADVLVGQDGLARAVRFVRTTTSEALPRTVEHAGPR